MSGSTSNGPTGRTLGSATSTVVSNLDPDDASITGWTEARARGAAALEDMSDIRVFNDPDLVLIYERINEHHFGGTLPLVLVHRGCPLDPEAIARDNNPLGVTSCWQSPTPGKSYVTIHVVDRLFDEEFPHGMPRWELIAKTMLHEMAHVAVQLDQLGDVTLAFEPGHEIAFANECNRIGSLMGWPLVLPDSEATCRDERASYWPVGMECEWCFQNQPRMTSSNRTGEARVHRSKPRSLSTNTEGND